MRLFFVIAALFACSGVQACPSPAKPQDGFFDRYTHIFSAVVTGVRLPRGDADVEMYVRNAALEKTERNIFIADGYAYDVQVEVTHVYKGKAPKSDWLSVEAGCKSQYPELFDRGVFAINTDGVLVAGYERQTEFFNYSDIIRALEKLDSRGR